MTKPEVRALAGEHGLALAQKPDSQEICFIPGGDYKQFLEAYLDEQEELMPVTAGALATGSGAQVGTHAGIHNFTVGQRKGLGLSGSNPLYVLAIDPATHTVTVGSEAELYTSRFQANRLNWVSVAEPFSGMRVEAKIRHRHEPAPATLIPISPEVVEVIFDQPQRAVTPGQAAVFYSGDGVVGGGWIV